MESKQSRRERYLRHKNCEKKYSCIEEKEAYEKIKSKWGFNDLQIKKLLKEYTIREIFFGGYINGEFKPKNLVMLGLLALLTSIWLGCYLTAEHKEMSYHECVIDIFTK